MAPILRPRSGVTPGTSSTYVALIRGINVGRHRRVSMADLRDVFAAIGADDVVTHLQSGNVVFDSPSGARKLVSAIEREIGARLDLDVSVLLRTPVELSRIVAGNPFATETDHKKLHVAFLEAPPSRGRVGALDPKRVAPDEFRVAGRHVYLHYPTGYGRSKLTNDYLEKQLSVRATMRNWKTVTALAGLARAGS